MATYPQLINFAPSNTQVQNDAKPQIVLEWSSDMEVTQFQNDATRASLVLLVDDVNSTVYPTVFTSSSTPLKRIILTPESNLPRGRTFRVVVKKQIKDNFGRKSDQEYQWTFVTAGSTLSTVTLTAPENASVQSVFPTLSWTSVASASGYQVQIDDRFDFGSPALDQYVVGVSLTPVGSFTSSTTYYWRVRAYTPSVSGDWSDIRSFYYGTPYHANAATRQALPDATEFGIKRIWFTNGASNLTAHPANISITYTTQPASDFENHITVLKSSVLPRNDSASSYRDSTVSGTWARNGNTIIFTPTEDIAKNTRYEIKIDRYLTSVDNIESGEDTRLYWCGVYAPFYCSPRAIRARFRAAEQLPEDLINYYIHRASMMAKARFQAYFYNSFNWGLDALSETYVRTGQDLTGHGVLLWTEACATYELLKSILFEELRNVDRTRVMQRFQDSLGPGFVDAVRLAMSTAKEEMEATEGLLTPANRAASSQRYADYTPENWEFDRLVGEEIGGRNSYDGGFSNWGGDYDFFKR